MSAIAEIDGRVISRPQVKVNGIAWVALLSLIGLVGLGFSQIVPPAPLPASAPQTAFSAERAFVHLSAIAHEPHPMGSDANRRVRDYLVGELTNLGLAPEIQKDLAINKYYYYRAAYPENIVARLPGTDSTRAVLLMAHYDSVPFASGANDDGTAVAAILETIRALQAGPALKNDVIVLFTDGEEGGAIGAKAFAESHPWVQEVGVVLNFEASGFYGPSLMFETSRGNQWLIGEFAAAAPRPMANSLMQDVYENLPQTTDFTVLKDAGLAGLNFAYVNGSTHNHTPLDNLEHANLSGLQHHGLYALSLARHFGNLNLNQPKRGDAVFFTLFSLVIHYPETAAIPLTILAALLFCALVAFGFNRKRLSFAGLGFGFLGLLLSLLVASGGVYILLMLIRAIHPEYQTRFWDIYNGDFYFAAFSAFAVAITASIYRLLRGKADVPNLLAGSLLGWSLVLVAITFSFPGASYLLLWPFVACLLLLAFQLSERWKSLSPLNQLLVSLVPLALAILLFIPMIYLIFVALTWQASATVVMILVLLCSLLLPLFDAIMASNRWLFPATLLVTGIGCIIAGSLTASFNAERPRANSLSYGFDADSGKAFWISADHALDEWTSQMLTANVQYDAHSDAFFPWSSTPIILGDAPLVQFPSPLIELLDDRVAGDSRILDLRVRSFRQAVLMTLSVDADMQVSAAVVAGKRVENQAAADEDWVLFFYSPPEDGFLLTLEVPAAQETVEIHVADRTYGLPALPDLKPRPESMMPMVFGYSDTTLVGKVFSFSASTE